MGGLPHWNQERRIAMQPAPVYRPTNVTSRFIDKQAVVGRGLG